MSGTRLMQTAIFNPHAPDDLNCGATRGKASRPEDRKATRPPVIGGLARSVMCGLRSGGAVAHPPVPDAGTFHLPPVNRGSLDPGAIPLGLTAGLPDCRTRTGACSCTAAAARSSFGPARSARPAPGLEQLGRTIPAAEPECEAECDRERADETDQQGIDQLGGDARAD